MNRWVLPLVIGCALTSGCRTAKPPPAAAPEPPRGYLNTLPAATAEPGVASARWVKAIQEVLAAHEFVFAAQVEGTEGRGVVVAARCRAATEVSQALVRLAPRGAPTVEIVTHSRVGATWVLLGEALQGPLKREALEMEHEIQAALPRPGP